MSKTNTGGKERLTKVLHSVNRWIEKMFSFSDSTVADNIIESIESIRQAERQDREARRMAPKR